MVYTPIALDRVARIGQPNGRYHEPACSRAKEDKEGVEAVALGPLIQDTQSRLGQRHGASQMMMVMAGVAVSTGWTRPSPPTPRRGPSSKPCMKHFQGPITELEARGYVALPLTTISYPAACRVRGSRGPSSARHNGNAGKREGNPYS